MSVMSISFGLPMKIDKTRAGCVSGITLDSFEDFRDVDAERCLTWSREEHRMVRGRIALVFWYLTESARSPM
jgi:hypothetical protein